MIEKSNIKTVGAKGRQIFFRGKAKQNIVGVKERQIFFSGKAKQNKVGVKERKIFLAVNRIKIKLEEKSDSVVSLLL